MGVSGVLYFNFCSNLSGLMRLVSWMFKRLFGSAEDLRAVDHGRRIMISYPSHLHNILDTLQNRRSTICKVKSTRYEPQLEARVARCARSTPSPSCESQPVLEPILKIDFVSRTHEVSPPDESIQYDILAERASRTGHPTSRPASLDIDTNTSHRVKHQNRLAILNSQLLFPYCYPARQMTNKLHIPSRQRLLPQRYQSCFTRDDVPSVKRRNRLPHRLSHEYGPLPIFPLLFGPGRRHFSMPTR